MNGVGLGRLFGRSRLTAFGVLAMSMAMFCFKFLYFDLIWALDTTFSGFQFPMGYVTKLLMAALLTLPLLLWRSRGWVVAAGLAVDGLLIANMLYFRSYYTIIPSSSYLLVGNLADFTDSVIDSFRLSDVVYPLSTLYFAWRLGATDIAGALRGKGRVAARTYLWCLGAPALALVAYLALKGGYKSAYEDLMYDYPTCGAAVYTIPGAIAYEFVAEEIDLTPDLKAEIDGWLAGRPDAGALPVKVEACDNCIVLLCESFENWVLGLTVEGQEITPRLNRLLLGDSVLYCPRVLDQVKGARSIDAQLIIHTGLLPVNYGAYSYRFPNHTYPSIDAEWKRQRAGGEAYSFTVDKRTVWNVALVARDFGYTIVDKPNFVLDVKTGPRGRLGDDSFLRQSYEKIAGDGVWRAGGHTLLQCVTYSGHTPFVIPDSLKRVSFSDAVPQRLRDYMAVANYTDRAIGEFVDRVRSNPKLAGSMIVITGDHEGVGIDREKFRRDASVAKWLEAEHFVPLIVLNSPVAGRYEGVMGQVDIYPTLLDLLGLWDGAAWRGLGQSILRPGKAAMAVDKAGRVVGDAAGLSAAQVEQARRVFDISDKMICSDYFRTGR